MILLKSMLNVIDNSGAAVAECVKVLKMKRAAKIGMSFGYLHIAFLTTRC